MDGPTMRCVCVCMCVCVWCVGVGVGVGVSVCVCGGGWVWVFVCAFVSMYFILKHIASNNGHNTATHIHKQLTCLTLLNQMYVCVCVHVSMYEHRVLMCFLTLSRVKTLRMTEHTHCRCISSSYGLTTSMM